MISIPSELDLGRDRSRMKDRRDAERQRATVELLLDRMYNRSGQDCSHLQLVADEVGMGKTFVALGLAYSVLAALRSGQIPRDLEDVVPRVLVIAPQNAALVSKWRREVGEFVKRCVQREMTEDAREIFRVSDAERIDDLVMELKRPGSGVVVTNTSVLSGGKKLLHYDLKRRVLLGALFRFWGKRFPYDDRARLLKGAPDWGNDPDALSFVNEKEADVLPLKSERAWVSALRELEAADQHAGASGQNRSEDLENLLELCKEIAQPYARDREDRFRKVESQLNALYRRVCFSTLRTALPLVIVDEAHNWKNGPRAKSNGYGGFERHIAPLCRRLLLLTATPFQLHPDEMLELVRAGEIVRPASDALEAQARTARLAELRNNTIRPVLHRSAERSRIFSKAWARLPAAKAGLLAEAWASPRLVATRARLRSLAVAEGVVSEPAVSALVDEAVLGVDPPDLRDIVREALWLYTYNQDLSQELSALVVRHRRNTEHRFVEVGSEYTTTEHRPARSDQHVLHAANGIDVRGEAELPHYLLMRAVSEMKQGRGRTSLGTALTGCYSTLLSSDEGRSLTSKLDPTSTGARYFAMLKDLVGEAQDPSHPKVRAVTEEVLTAWQRGEKTLVFCFRTHTAKRLAQILSDLSNGVLGDRMSMLGISEEDLRRVRSRMTRRDEALITLLLDRVLWSLCWAARASNAALPAITVDDLRLRDSELTDLARLALRAGMDLRAAAPDRVFVHRATEHILARRLVAEKPASGPLFRQLCQEIGSERWVTHPYGVDLAEEAQRFEASGTVPDEEEDDGHTPRKGGIEAIYTLDRHVTESDVSALAEDLVKRRAAATDISILDSYADGPNLWLGTRPVERLSHRAHDERALELLHDSLLRLTRDEARTTWAERLLAMSALRRTVLSRGLLVRMLPGKLEREAHGWASTLVERFFASTAGQHESMAERVAVFMEDFQAATGPTLSSSTSRHALLEATRAQQNTQAVLITGSTPADTRNRAFVGFNSPGLPDILVCTSVGAEGIDLHRHCRNVVHYDLAWNPAVLEQRTGRVDRIGSKTFRDRTHAPKDAPTPFLEIGVPFLAGTYDERMFEELRIRAQIFEVLTGGEVSADNLEGDDTEASAEGGEAGLSLPVLPDQMVDDLRVKLHVWADGVASTG